RRPILVMTKYLDKENTLLVLRLWDAHLKTDTGLPLWLGTVGYHHRWGHYFLSKKHQEKLAEDAVLVPATQLLIKDLNGFTWKQVHYQQIPTAIAEVDTNWNGNVLLIRP